MKRRWVLWLPLGVAFVLMVFLDSSAAQESVTATPAVASTPTIDRLAPPPTVENPTQADEGAYHFWLNCQPCHGDQGQGLTDEWRAQYPPEDQNCWNAGCHGNLPYESGFKLPTTVPAVIGQGSLARFVTLEQVYHFTRAAMPFQAPGSLSDEEYLAITAFLARAHGVWDGTTPLTETNLSAVRLQPITTPDVREDQIVPAQQETNPPTATSISRFWLWLGVAGILLAGGIWLWHRYN